MKSGQNEGHGWSVETLPLPHKLREGGITDTVRAVAAVGMAKLHHWEHLSAFPRLFGTVFFF